MFAAWCRSGGRRARQNHAGEAGALEPILVVHRRLVDEIGERALGLAARLRKKIKCGSAQNRDRRVVGGDVHQQPVGRPARRCRRAPR